MVLYRYVLQDHLPYLAIPLLPSLSLVALKRLYIERKIYQWAKEIPASFTTMTDSGESSQPSKIDTTWAMTT